MLCSCYRNLRKGHISTFHLIPLFLSGVLDKVLYYLNFRKSSFISIMDFIIYSTKLVNLENNLQFHRYENSSQACLK